MHKYQTLIDALALEPTSALFTHPRDDNKWKENERFAIACEPEVIRSLLEDNERLRDALQELVESHLEKFPVFEAGISAQEAWAVRRGKAMSNAVSVLSITGAKP